MNYRLALSQSEPERILYLAIPLDIYDSFFHLRFAQMARETYQLNIIVYDSEQEVITKWIN